MPSMDPGQALSAWLTASTGLAETRVVFAEDSEPRPPTPYAVLKLRAPAARVGSYDELRPTDDPDVFEYVGMRRLLVSVALVGAGAAGLLEAALAALETEARQADFASAGMSFVEHAEASERTRLVPDDGAEQADVSFHVVASRLETLSHVAAIEGSGAVNDTSFDYTLTE